MATQFWLKIGNAELGRGLLIALKHLEPHFKVQTRQEMEAIGSVNLLKSTQSLPWIHSVFVRKVSGHLDLTQNDKKLFGFKFLPCNCPKGPSKGGFKCWRSRIIFQDCSAFFRKKLYVTKIRFVLRFLHAFCWKRYFCWLTDFCKLLITLKRYVLERSLLNIKFDQIIKV